MHETDEFRRQLRASARLLQENRPAEALEILLPLYNSAPGDPDVAINLGGAYILQRKWNRAVQVLKQAAAVHSENVMVWTNLAAAYLGNLALAGPDHQRQAIAAYERVLTLDPKAPNIHYHLGLIYKERGELPQARAYFAQALEVNPLDRDARHWLKRLEERTTDETGE